VRVKLQRGQLLQIRRRHLGYRITLAYELLLVVLMPAAGQISWLLSLLLILLALELMVFISRFSMLQRSKPLIYGLGCLAMVLELIWHFSLVWNLNLGRVLAIPHLIVWIAFIWVSVIRKISSLIREPFVTFSVVLGAVSGYLSIGIAGGLSLTALWVLQPEAFVAAALPAPPTGMDPTLGMGPALMVASFGLLTTVGTTVLNSANLTAQMIANMITIAGQLYIAILIGLILGRVNQRAM